MDHKIKFKHKNTAETAFSLPLQISVGVLLGVLLEEGLDVLAVAFHHH